MTARFCGFLLVAGLAACGGNTLPGAITCSADASCPFEQCCVAGTCVDPGPAGSCVDAAGATSALTIADTVKAGVTVPFLARLNDTHGRPVAGVQVNVALESTCDTCETVTIANQTTDASGAVTGTFTSTRAEAKTFTVSSSGGAAGASKVVNVIAGDAATLGFVGVADTPVDQPLSAIAVTRLDAYGNPDAAVTSAIPEGLDVSVAVSNNPLNLGFWSGGAQLQSGTVDVKLEGPRASIGEVTIPVVAHGLTLTGQPGATPGGTASFVSDRFSVIGPHFESAMPDPLVASDGDVRVDWSVTPQIDARIVDGNFLGPPMTAKTDSGASINPIIKNGAGHIRVVQLAERSSYDVEANQLSRAEGLFGTLATGAVVDRVHALPGGDVVVLGRFWGELILTPSAKITGIAGYTDTNQSYVARFSNDFSEVRWYAATYAFTESGMDPPGVATVIRDSEVTADGALMVLTQFTAQATGWDYQAAGVRRRCVVSGGVTRAAAGIARLNVATGELTYCASLRDSSQATSVGARVLRTLSQQHYVALTGAPSILSLYTGVNRTASGAPVFIPDNTMGGIGIDAGNHDCGIVSVGLIVPLIDAPGNPTSPVTLGASLVSTRVFVQADSMEVDAAGSGLTIGATVCAAGSPLQAGGASVTTSGNDGMLLHLTGATLTPVWQARCAGDDGPTRAVGLEDGTYAVMMNFAGVCLLDPGQASRPAGGIIVGRVKSATGLTASSVLTSEQTVVGRGFARRGDRIVFSAYAASDLAISGATYAAIYGTGVALFAEADANFNVRWSSQGLGLNSSSGAFDLMDSGRTLATLNGAPAAMTAAPLDANPPSVPVSTGQLRPLVYTLEPYDFIVRDVR